MKTVIALLVGLFAANAFAQASDTSEITGVQCLVQVSGQQPYTKLFPFKAHDTALGNVETPVAVFSINAGLGLDQPPYVTIKDVSNGYAVTGNPLWAGHNGKGEASVSCKYGKAE